MRTFLEFFAGIGLVRLGLERVGWKCIWANDIDQKKLKLYLGHFSLNGGHYVVDDIHQITADEVPSASLATCSFPCVDMSVAGWHAGFGAERNDAHKSSGGTFWEWVRILRQMGDRQPYLVLVENVLGFLSANGGRDFREAMIALNDLGYTIDAFVLDARHFTPQSRPRLFIVGAQGIDPLPAYSIIGSVQSRSADLRPERLVKSLTVNADLKWMRLDLPAPPPKNHYLESIIEYLPDDDPRWWPPEKIERLYKERLSDKHLAMVKELITGDQITYRTAFNRVRRGRTYTEVRSDDYAGCLRTPLGGSGRQIVIAAGQSKLRARLMTAREAARLQGVPDDYPLVDNLNDNLWGFGDAVCVPAIEWIGKYALNPLYEKLMLEKAE